MGMIGFLRCQQTLYGPGDNYDLNSSHVLTSAIAKIS
jgi:hypothetical protein